MDELSNEIHGSSMNKNEAGTGNGQITFYGIKATRPVQRFVSGQVRKWIHKQPFAQEFADTNYRVTLDRAMDQHYFRCDLEISMGDHIWEGHEEGSTLEEALSHSIKKLHVSGWGKVA